MSLHKNRTKLLLAVATLTFVGSAWISMQQAAPAAEGNPKIDKLKLLPGFKAEHLYTPTDHEQGSWVAMTFDDKGRLIVSDQYGFLYRLTLPPVGAGSQAPKVEKLNVPIASGQTADPSKVGMGYAQGVLYAFNSLYVMVNNRESKDFEKGSGLYRLQDTNGDDEFDKITLLKAMVGQGEHGPHSIVMAPDKQSLYVIAGNHTDLPEMDAYRLPKTFQDDNLFPKITDPRGHAATRGVPGGWIAHIDPDGKRWELVSAGYRNPFDIAFNENGDMFTYDSDMEWDFGTPWYRPTRICHATSGSEYGWRTGNGKWLPANPDNLPPVMNIGQGSPTNVMYGQNAKFPAKYRQSLYAFDWSFGIIYSIQLKPKGASYDAVREEFLSGSPLALTDGVIGPDGAMYFMTGGRKLDSDLYRVYYNGPESTAPVAVAPPTKENQLRRQLEQFHSGSNPGALAVAWPHLNHPDRFVRYAARIAVEHQPISGWQERALTETDPQRATQAIIALARSSTVKKDDSALRGKMIDALTKVNYAQLSESQQFDIARAFELIMIRTGTPGDAEKAKIIAYLNPHYPAKTAGLNRELSRVLISLDAPGVIDKTLNLMALKDEPGSNDLGLTTTTASSDLILRNPQYGLDIARMLANVPPLQQTFYATMLSQAKTGWTPALRDQYFGWFGNALNYQGGLSYIGFIDRARKLALANVPKEQVAKYNKLSGADRLSESGNGFVSDYTPKGPGRAWQVETALAVLDSNTSKPSFDTGQKIYAAVLCARCHAMGAQGGDIGPNLSQLGTRFSDKDMLEAIIHPNKAISDQYASTIFTLKNGQSVLGRLVSEDKTSYSVSQNPFAADELRKIVKKDVVSTKVSTVSIMLPGLINSLNPTELTDLVAYLKAGGNADNSIYKRTDKGAKGR